MALLIIRGFIPCPCLSTNINFLRFAGLPVCWFAGLLVCCFAESRHAAKSAEASRVMHVCYFSKKCRFCQAFFEELSQTPFTKEIRFVCVDPSPGRPPLPAWLKSVPALVVAGEDSPRVGPAAVNNWLFERKMGASGTSQAKPAPAPAPAQGQQRMPEPISANTPASSKQGPPVLANSAMEGIEAWHGAEMSGGAWSDEYSFLDDSFTSDKGYNPIVRNWESLAGPVTGRGSGGAGGAGGAGAGAGKGGLGAAGFSGGSGGGGPAKSAKEEKLLNEFEQFSKMRDMEFSPIKRM
jgi:hypothetical protein